MLSVHCQSGYKHPINCWTCLLQKFSPKKKASGSDIIADMGRVFRKLSIQKGLQICVWDVVQWSWTTEYIWGSIPLCGSIIGLHYLRGCCRWAVKGGATSNAITANVRIGTSLGGEDWLFQLSPLRCLTCWSLACIMQREGERECWEFIIEGVAGSPCCVCWNVSRLAFGVGHHDLRL